MSSIYSIPQDIDAKLRSLPGFHTYKAGERRHISYKGKIPVDGDQNISINWGFSFNVVPTIHINKDDDKLLEQLGLSPEVLEKSTGANTKQIFLSSVSVSKEIYSKEDFELNMGELDNPSARIGRSPICKTAEEAFKLHLEEELLHLPGIVAFSICEEMGQDATKVNADMTLEALFDLQELEK